MCIDIVEIWFRIVNGQILSISDSFLYFHFWMITICQWLFTKLGVCFGIVETSFGIADGQISSIFDSYLPATSPSTMSMYGKN